jgi:hypothetical protein
MNHTSPFGLQIKSAVKGWSRICGSVGVRYAETIREAARPVIFGGATAEELFIA